MKHFTFSTLILSLALCFSLLLSSITFASQAKQESAVLLDKGNRAYSEGLYSEAITFYEMLLVQKGPATAILYNLANAYAQNGQTGKAVLNYERALFLSHGDSDVRGNLDLIRKNKGLFQEEFPLHQRFLNLLGLNQWAMTALICLLLFTALQVTGLRYPLARNTRIWSSTCLTLIFILSLTASFSHYRQWYSAVVISPDVRLLLSPFPSASSAGILQEGRTVVPEKKHENFYLVEDETGRRGWIHGSSLEFVTNPHPSLPQKESP